MDDHQDHEHDDPEARERAAETIKAAMSAIEDATFDILMSKPTRETEFFVHVRGEDSRTKPVRIRYRALDPKAFDDLMAAHPPSGKAQRDGAQWDKDSFPPALVSAVSLVPKMTEAQAADLLASKNWSTGESQALFYNAINVCQAGLDVPFNAGG